MDDSLISPSGPSDGGVGPPAPKERGLKGFVKRKNDKRAAKKMERDASEHRSSLVRNSVDPMQRAAARSKRKSRFTADRDKPKAGEESRTVPLDGGRATEGFAHNMIKTAKYNPITFLPIFLFEMFSRVAYLYFLFQAGLTWWKTVSPYGGLGSTAALVFVLLVAGVKAVVEDVKRHQEDRETNKSTAHVMQLDGTFVDVAWRAVKVGQIVKVCDDELFPADLVCLASSLADNVAFIKTTNLDGENNLKIRSTLNLMGADVEEETDWQTMRGTLQCELPNANLHVFKGRFEMHDAGDTPVQRTMPVTMNEMLLRGCTLKNTGHVLGMVVYTGEETRIQQNSVETPLKYGSFDRFLNVQICLIILLQIVMCAVHGSIALGWRNRYGVQHYYLALDVTGQGNYTNSTIQWFIDFLTFWILYSYLVPISLFVTMEIVKFWQGSVFINKDPAMVDAQGQHAKARNTNLNEDLGKVSYIFSDKTGTLTSNEMQLRQIAILGTAYGTLDYRLEDHPDVLGPQALAGWDPVLAREDPASELGQAQIEFWTNICLCNSLIVEPNPVEGGVPIFQGPSPDELALAEGARQLGFEFLGRSSSGMSLRLQGIETKYQVLNVLEYSSARARMSVIVRAPDDSIHLFCKGADTKVLEMVRGSTEEKLMADTEHSLHQFAINGLRTLVLATKSLEEEEWEEWDARYQEAAADLSDRDDKLAAAAEEVERDLLLTGITAIEDKLQDGVPAAIQTLLMADIKVWVITGDKQETAINIAISCKLILNPDTLMICNASDYDGARARVLELLRQVEKNSSTGSAKPELVIDGHTLSFILERDTEAILAQLGSHCGAVVICRASPSQKAAIVHMMDEFELRRAGGRSRGLLGAWRRTLYRLKGKMLAIGDGANDVAMIQAADIGVGIMGKEGRQAVNNSDYAIGRFRFLVQLLFVHGTLSHYRLSRLIKYSFYKNIVFCFMLFFFQFYAGYSGQALVDGVTAALYNVTFTSFPILLFAVLDRPVKHFITLIRYPQMYFEGKSMTSRVFWRYSVLTAVVGGAVSFFLPYYAITSSGQNSVADIYSIGKIVFIIIVAVVNVEVALTARYWTNIFIFFVVLSYVCAYIFMIVYMEVATAFNSYDPAQYGVIYQICRAPTFWFLQIAVVLLTLGYRMLDRSLVWLDKPHNDMLLAEAESMNKGPLAGLEASEAIRLSELKLLPVMSKDEPLLPGASSNGTSAPV